MRHTLSLVLLLTSFLLPNAYAVEWQHAQKGVGASVYLPGYQLPASYKVTPGLGLDGDYQVPLFVEGHSRAYLMGSFHWVSPAAEADETRHGATFYSLEATTGFLADIDIGSDRVAWIGGGFGLQALYSVNHYSWSKDGNSWVLNTHPNKKRLTGLIQGRAIWPLTKSIKASLRLDFPVVEPGIAQYQVGLRYQF